MVDREVQAGTVPSEELVASPAVAETPEVTPVSDGSSPVKPPIGKTEEEATNKAAVSGGIGTSTDEAVEQPPETEELTTGDAADPVVEPGEPKKGD